MSWGGSASGPPAGERGEGAGGRREEGERGAVIRQSVWIYGTLIIGGLSLPSTGAELSRALTGVNPVVARTATMTFPFMQGELGVATMQAMVCEGPGRPLVLRTLPRPEPGPGQVLIAVRACGVCRTDLHLVDGELPDPKVPVIPGHEIVGTVAALGSGVAAPVIGTRVGVPWLGRTCGHCGYCATGRENLCADARFTGYQLDGGYAEYAVADARFVFPLPDRYDDLTAAPLLCAGLIGYRAYAMAGEAPTLGIYGFGAAAHLIAQVALAQGRTVFAFTRPGDRDAQALRAGARACTGQAAATSGRRRRSTRR